jgi:hypothetical protein
MIHEIAADVVLLGQKTAVFHGTQQYLGRTRGYLARRNSLMNKPLALISRT